LLEARLLDKAPAIIRDESQERKIESRPTSTATVEVSAQNRFTITYDPNPTEDDAIALNHGTTPTMNWWDYNPDTLSGTLMAGEVTWVKNPISSVKLRSDGLTTKYEVTGCAGTGSVTVEVSKGTTQLFTVSVTPATASSGAIQGVRAVHYTNNTTFLEFVSNGKEIEIEVGGFLFP
jgi:hypothetical protein